LSNTSILQDILGSGNEELFMTVLVIFCEQIVWNQDLAEMALDLFPECYLFLPACFRSDNVDAQQLMALLLNLKYDGSNYELFHQEMVSKVDGAISASPEFFADPAALDLVFHEADGNVVCQIVKRLCHVIPWDRNLTLLASRYCQDDDDDEDDEEDRDSMTDKEIRRMYKGIHDCKRHLPLGMFLSCLMVDALDVWPDFLNKCRCAVVQDDLVMLAALDLVEPALLRSRLSQQEKSWFQELVRQIRSKFQNRLAFHNWLKCITLADGRGHGAMELFRGDGDTSIALKRNIAEFLGAFITPAALKHSALEFVYCLLTMPWEALTDIVDSRSNVLKHRSYLSSFSARMAHFIVSDVVKHLQN
jgi:hypothetical protein